MRSLNELKQRLAAYGAAEYIYNDEACLAWHTSTGGNIEMLFIETARPRSGAGTRIYREFCERLIKSGAMPYHSVFGFRLGSNSAAKAFYDSLGWAQMNIGVSIYRDDETVLMWTTFATMRKHFGL